MASRYAAAFVATLPDGPIIVTRDGRESGPALVQAICRSLSDAGRKMFTVSQSKRRSRNDADRLRKYLARFGLSWDAVVTHD